MLSHWLNLENKTIRKKKLFALGPVSRNEQGFGLLARMPAAQFP
jgi:hypothetical protein